MKNVQQLFTCKTKYLTAFFVHFKFHFSWNDYYARSRVCPVNMKLHPAAG